MIGFSCCSVPGFFLLLGSVEAVFLSCRNFKSSHLLTCFAFCMLCHPVAFSFRVLVFSPSAQRV